MAERLDRSIQNSQQKQRERYEKKNLISMSKIMDLKFEINSNS